MYLFAPNREEYRTLEWYTEKIVSKKGRIVRDVSEPLRKHRARGVHGRTDGEASRRKPRQP